MPPLFKNERSLVRSFSTFKGGEYKEVFYTIASAIYKYAECGDLAAKRFLMETRAPESLFRDWFQDGARYSPLISGSLDPRLNSFFVGRLGDNEVWDQAARRLLQFGTVVTENQLLVHQQVEDLSEALLSSDSTEVLIGKLKDFRNLNKVKQEFSSFWVKARKMNEPTRYATSFKEVGTLIRLTSKGNHLLKASLRDDRIFLAEAVDTARANGLMKVPIKVTWNLQALPQRFNYILNPDERVAEEKLLRSLFAKTTESYPQDYLDDDLLIKVKVHEWLNKYPGLYPLKIAVIVTDDKKLCKELHESTKGIVVIIAISPSRDNEQIARMITRIQSENVDATIKIYEDTGSIRASEKLNFRDRFKLSIHTVYNPNSSSFRFLKKTVKTHKIPIPDLVLDKRGFLTEHLNYDKPRYERKLLKQ